jgi:aminobenzoyl-glutamate utilization protein B
MKKHHALEIAELVERNRAEWTEASDQIWDFAELRFEERQSSDLLCELFTRHGFVVERGVAGLPTAFVATAGSGGPVIGFLGEYDALPELSQRAGIARHDPLVAGGNGHGCGHNLLGVGAAAAALAARDYLATHQLPGTVRYFGCPAEEGGGGKVIMVKAGLFQDVDAALTWHPGNAHYVQSCSTLATQTVDFRFFGRSAHAAAAPHLGRSALDAVELMNVGANFLREHIPPEARLHYAITNTGGAAPNVVQPEASVRYQFRSPKGRQVDAIYPRLCDVARGAALMTGTRVEIEERTRYLNVIPNTTIEALAQKILEQLGVPDVNEADLAFAREIRASLLELEAGELPESRPPDLAQSFRPFHPHGPLWPVSTDVGDVSWVTPTLQYRSAVWATDTEPHTWQATAQGKCAFAHKGTLHAGKVLGATAVELFQRPELLRAAREELTAALREET